MALMNMANDKKLWIRIHPNPSKMPEPSNSLGFVLYHNGLIDQEKVIPPFFYIIDKYFDRTTRENATAVIFHVGATLYHVAIPLAKDLIVHRERWGGPIRVHNFNQVSQKYTHVDITWLRKKPMPLKYVS